MQSEPRAPESRRWERRILLRYTLLQLPALALLIAVLWLLATWFELPRLWLGLVAVIWIIKDIALFPLVWRAYDPEATPRGNTLVGGVARVVQELSPEGVVEIQGELWRARSAQQDLRLQKDSLVHVTAMQGLLLEVTPLPPSSPENAASENNSHSPSLPVDS
jgi:membrane protein implicated in regulation of membrane protease activity